MKNKFLVLILLVFTLSFLAGCEKSTQLRTAYIREITMAGSDNYGVRITYDTDDRLEGKSTDVQIKFNNIGTIKIGEEFQEKFEYKIEDYDEWYSMTAILAQAKGKAGEEKFEKYEEAISKTYQFQYDGQMKITLRVVVGDSEENSAGNGEILVGSESVSENFTLKIN